MFLGERIGFRKGLTDSGGGSFEQIVRLRRSRSHTTFWSSFIIFLVFGLSVLVANVVLSFFSWSALTPPTFIGLDNYRRLFHDAVFGKRS